MYIPPIIWSMFYSGLVHMAAHPRNEGGPDLVKASKMADDMCVEYLRRFGIDAGTKCPYCGRG